MRDDLNKFLGRIDKVDDEGFYCATGALATGR